MKVENRMSVIASATALFWSAAVLATGIPAKPAGSFPYAGQYRSAWCVLTLDPDGRFEMRNMDCAFPDSIQAPGQILVMARGHARVEGDRLQLRFNENPAAASPPDQELFVLRCATGPRFLPVGNARDFAIAKAAADPQQLDYAGSFGHDAARVDDACDLAPLPSALRRIADSQPILSTVREVVGSKCEGAGRERACEASVRIDRGVAAGVVADMPLYFPACRNFDYAMHVSSSTIDSAEAVVLWDPTTFETAAALVGATLTTRMPACLPRERDRINQRREQESP
jgi:hypothetical protein